ncbi:MAG: hypothetical protein A3F40_00320 [Chlamydiae bacterium RIFCSPHIGHO2_12_FULL_27_8]|nr:MAG: hypothetical protein A3F40_00320 [Chlamydiae bacterium RIFCSPHIGHO2_12_FULL_27_8]
MMKLKKLISATLLIAGTSIGAGMLGIPLVTASSGFIPSLILTFVVWLFMYATGLLFLEATLWMHDGANVLSMTNKFYKRKGKILAGITFVFLYYCLMVAYFSGGAPLLSFFLEFFLNIKISSFVSILAFGVIFGTIVGFGIKLVDRVNYILMIGLILSYFILFFAGAKHIEFSRLKNENWANIFYAVPILFSAFGYHNVIPSLTFHFHRNVKLMRYAIFFGSFIPFLIYILWQYLILGSVSPDVLNSSLKTGSPYDTLKAVSNVSWISYVARFFGFFAIITSMLGVSFSVVDFLGDGLNFKRVGKDRVFLCLLTFVPPLILTLLDPSIFIIALGVAGGFGEAILNGVLPALLVWKGRYKYNLNSHKFLFGGKFLLIIILLGAIAVTGIEILHILKLKN